MRTPGIGTFQKGLGDVSGEGGLDPKAPTKAELFFTQTSGEGTHRAQTHCRAMQQQAGFAPPVLEWAVTKEHGQSEERATESELTDNPHH